MAGLQASLGARPQRRPTVRRPRRAGVLFPSDRSHRRRSPTCPDAGTSWRTVRPLLGKVEEGRQVGSPDFEPRIGISGTELIGNTGFLELIVGPPAAQLDGRE